MNKYTQADLEENVYAYNVYQSKAEKYRRAARDCLIRIVAIRKELGSDSQESNRFQESLAKLKKG